MFEFAHMRWVDAWANIDDNRLRQSPLPSQCLEV